MKTRLKLQLKNRDSALFVAFNGFKTFIVDYMLTVIASHGNICSSHFVEKHSSYVLECNSGHISLYGYFDNDNYGYTVVNGIVSINAEALECINTITKCKYHYDYLWNGDFTICRPKTQSLAYRKLPAAINQAIIYAHGALGQLIIGDILRNIMGILMELWRVDVSWYRDKTPNID